MWGKGVTLVLYKYNLLYKYRYIYMIKYKKYVCLNFLIFNCAAARAYFNFNTKEEDVIFINNLLKKFKGKANLNL